MPYPSLATSTAAARASAVIRGLATIAVNAQWASTHQRTAALASLLNKHTPTASPQHKPRLLQRHSHPRPATRALPPPHPPTPAPQNPAQAMRAPRSLHQATPHPARHQQRPRPLIPTHPLHHKHPCHSFPSRHPHRLRPLIRVIPRMDGTRPTTTHRTTTTIAQTPPRAANAAP